jgi:hypothetical protein
MDLAQAIAGLISALVEALKGASTWVGGWFIADDFKQREKLKQEQEAHEKDLEFSRKVSDPDARKRMSDKLRKQAKDE